MRMNYTRMLCIVSRMIDDNDNRLLMSDSLRGMLPDLEDDQLKLLSDAFVIATIELLFEQNVEVVAGSLAGASFDNLEIKLDIRAGLNDAYDVIKKFKTSGLSCRLFYLHRGDDEICFEGPYKISSTKIMDFDRQLKMCTIGFDLIRA